MKKKNKIITSYIILAFIFLILIVGSTYVRYYMEEKEEDIVVDKKEEDVLTNELTDEMKCAAAYKCTVDEQYTKTCEYILEGELGIVTCPHDGSGYENEKLCDPENEDITKDIIEGNIEYRYLIENTKSHETDIYLKSIKKESEINFYLFLEKDNIVYYTKISENIEVITQVDAFNLYTNTCYFNSENIRSLILSIPNELNELINKNEKILTSLIPSEKSISDEYEYIDYSNFKKLLN